MRLQKFPAAEAPGLGSSSGPERIAKLLANRSGAASWSVLIFDTVVVLTSFKPHAISLSCIPQEIVVRAGGTREPRRSTAGAFFACVCMS